MTQLILVLASLAAVNPSLAQGVCRDEFVACVAQSGDILACRSVYTNCEAELGNDLIAASYETSDELSSYGDLTLTPMIQNTDFGLSSIRLLVSNSSQQPVQVSTATYPVRCADGSSDRAVFFMNFMVDAGVENQSAGSDQLVCIGAGGVTSIDQGSAEITGLASVGPQLEYEFPCANDQFQWIYLNYQPQGIFRWRNSQGTQGTINQTFVEESSFAELACTPMAIAEPDMIIQARRQISEWMGDPPPGKQIYYRSKGIGVRN